MRIMRSNNIGVIGTVQLLTIGIMNIISGASSSTVQCIGNGSNCANSVILSIIFIVLITIWYLILWVLALIVEAKRQKRLAQLLFLAEFAILPIALFDLFKQKDLSLPSYITNILYIVFLLWVNYSLLKIIKYGNRRMRLKNKITEE